MKSKFYLIFLTLALIIIGLIWINGDLFAQENEKETPVGPPEEVPFIDRDGDGVNDILQHGWGLRFLMRHKRLEAIKERQQDGEGPRGPILVDTDGDGKGDTYMHEFMNGKLDEDKLDMLIDTDNDGTPDTPVRDLLRKRFGTFDRNGDGQPDVGTPEEIRQHMMELRQWRQQMMQRIKDGLPPISDENDDGIPDDLPPGVRWQERQHGENHNPDNK